MDPKRTKIIATIGPASDSSSKIRSLMASGVDIFRFNTKHSDIEWHNERIKKVQNIAIKEGKNIGIMIDLQGGEIRLKTRDEKRIKTRKGETLTIGSSFLNEESDMIISEKEIFRKISPKDPMLIDDGKIELRVVEVRKESLKVSVIEGGIIKNRKSVNFPGTGIKLSSLIEKDMKNLDSAAVNNVAFVALSFVGSKDDILILKKEMEKRKMNAAVVSKIENQEAIRNIDEIIQESDAIMIARGDLGIEIPIEGLAYWQKNIIRKCRENRKPVIVATQMLHSMVKNNRPTRAEATDVANAVFDGTDAVMLSEETALGKNPARSVMEMAKILKFNEKKSEFPDLQTKPFNPTEFVVGAIAKEMIKRTSMKIKTSVVFTESGHTARVLSSFRTKTKIIAVTDSKKTAEQLSLSYGVIPYRAAIKFEDLKLSEEIARDLAVRGLLSKNETVAVFHGRHGKKPHLLNLFSLTKIR